MRLKLIIHKSRAAFSALTTALVLIRNDSALFRSKLTQRLMTISVFRKLFQYLDISPLDPMQTASRKLEQPFTRNFRAVRSIELDNSKQEPVAMHYLNNSLPYTKSGYTIRTHEMLKSLQNRGLICYAYTRVGYPSDIGHFAKNDSTKCDSIIYSHIVPFFYKHNEAKRTSQAVRLLTKEAAKHGATILHTTTPYTNAVVISRVAANLKLPWIYEVRGEPEQTWLSKLPKSIQSKAIESEFYAGSRQAETQAMQAAAAVICLSKVSKSSMSRRGVNPSKIYIAPNSVDFEKLKSHKPAILKDSGLLRKNLGLKDFILVGTVSSIVRYEGLETLIHAAEMLPAHYRIIIIGDGEHRTHLEQLAQRLNIADRVLFMGHQPIEDIEVWYGLLDVFVVPRMNEEVCKTVTPIKPLMAMSLGIPVVASDLPALREVTGNFAHYVTPNSPKLLAKAITTQTEKEFDPAIDAWIENRSWERNAQLYEALYAGTHLTIDAPQ